MSDSKMRTKGKERPRVGDGGRWERKKRQKPSGWEGEMVTNVEYI